MRPRLLTAGLVIAVLTTSFQAQAGALTKGLREALEYVGKKFGREVAEEGAERVSVKLTRLAAKHGDEVVSKAFRRVGPRAGRLVEQAGDQGGLALSLLARHGEQAVPLIGKASALNAVARFGDDAAVALIKHGTVGEKVVTQFAKEGAEALAKVTPQNGRRLAMLAAEGHMKPELMQVITRYGDQACEFIWKNKGALAIGTTLTAFVSSPGAFLDGTQKLTATVADAAVRPLAEVPKAVAVEAAKNANWTVLGALAMTIASVAGYFRLIARRLNAPSSSSSSPKSTSESSVAKP
jgi:hypothetical protein